MTMKLELTRRQALLAGVGAVAVASGLGAGARPAVAATEDANALIMEFTGGAEPAMGRVTLDVPEIAENGNTVPMDVFVESPMTDEDHVTDVLIVADGNPRAGVATFHFSPMSGVAQANTRIRLAGTQNVIAVAKMSDGSVFMDRKEVKVTIGGCGG
ncbi:thiosulfate oxidation carrier protein SoxY [Salinarimonas ramus]|uniref:Thiosulfate oxidation carrier protein SoxY n=1 Tax=Salinarimonas ramus TaxID=690164 RepID=A0A917V6G4_9HYPH|nr:thiosulfate oxidation carrier protein SoxY [Salinarimonas ramus]GGK44478.1 thiosulfate oxidation carrier protein SoxY [Salinarimonas ramus]